MGIERSNIFKFATSELSQDAFLCWLIDSARMGPETPLGACGRAFVLDLWARAGHRPAEAATVQILEEPSRQRFDSDISFRARIDGRDWWFVIEDKVDAGLHGRQLEKYRRAFLDELVAGENASANDAGLVLIYLKTGFHYDDGGAARGEGYAVVAAEDLAGFLGDHPIAHDVYGDFLKNLEDRIADRRRVRDAWFHGDTRVLAHAQAQWEFLQALQGRLVQAAPQDLPDLDLYRGTSFGRPWTQLKFLTRPDAFGPGADETLFYRVDTRADQAYLSLRQYAKVTGDDAWPAKAARRDGFRKAFLDAVRDEEHGLSFANTHNRGRFESEIAILFFGATDQNTIANVLENWPRLHRRFCIKARSAGLLP